MPKKNQNLPDIALLRSFCTIAETRSLSTAATLLGQSQPAISQQLQRLEAHLGSKLVRRSRRPLALTAEGELLATELPQILESLALLVNKLQSVPGATRQRLKIAMPDSMSCSMGAEFLSVAGKLADSVELCAGIAPWEEDVFQADQFDLLVDSHPFDPKEFAHPVEILLDPYVIITSPKSKGTSLEEIIQTEPQIAYAGTTKFGQRAARIAKDIGAQENPKYSFDSSQSILRFVQIGYGWAITSMMCLYQSPQSIREIELHVLDKDKKRTLMLLSRAEELSDLSDQVVSMMQDVFRQLVNGPWGDISPKGADLVRSANPAIFANPE